MIKNLKFSPLWESNLRPIALLLDYVPVRHEPDGNGLLFIIFINDLVGLWSRC